MFIIIFNLENPVGKTKICINIRIKLLKNPMGKYMRKQHDNHVYALTISSPKKTLWGKTRWYNIHNVDIASLKTSYEKPSKQNSYKEKSST
jgi:hypothetical protein